MTELSRDSRTTTRELAAAACFAAMDDAGASPADVDAVLCYHMSDSSPVNDVARRLGLPNSIWTNEIFGGGTQSASILGDAAMLIESGTASNVLVYRALNGRSGARMGRTSLRLGADAEAQFTVPYGMLGPVNLFALSTTKWMNDVGLDRTSLEAVVRSSRELAANNPRALMRAPMSSEEYRASPMIATPLSRVDCCQETDGAAALLISRTDIADNRRAGSPRIRAVVRGGGPGASAMDSSPDLSTIFTHYVADLIWSASGMTSRDIDVSMIYDAYSPVVLQQLEDLGFARRGESGALFESGETCPTGRVPVNPNGGLLSEGYVHGLNNVLEAVRQLRGDSGINQVPGASTALCTGFGGSYGSAAVLERV
ncbi:thiolase C-terminal domain-containing protein [Rhodococcus sp. 077-4]|uniref:thiolase C-terminal domain-containing protein n=1 Tax=Rhodococcus sp. 077-4 TaxID=2789271 RepID=UPI0039F51712